MSNVADFNVTNEDVKHLCDFMGIDAVRHGKNSFSWSDGVHYMTHEDDYHKCMSNIWRYVGTRKVKDWNWLMSIVDKIESIGYIFGISGRSCMIVGRNSDTHVFNVSKYGDNKMSSVYECCTSFVKWYNANVK